MKKVAVDIDFGEGAFPVGELLEEGKRVFFRYDTDYIARGHNLSPLQLQFNAEIQSTKTGVFDGLYGVFSDSLPDGWGRLLLDRQLNRMGVDLNTVGPLDRLAYVGEKGKGALRYRPIYQVARGLSDGLSALDELAENALRVLRDYEIDGLPELLRLGGSSGGARPKIQILYQPETGNLLPDMIPVPKGYEAWIIKFPATNDAVDSARVEFAYYRAARAANLEMSESRLFTGASGKPYFGTRRFDRGLGEHRVHLHSLAGLLHDNFRLPAIDYGHLMDVSFRLEQDVEAYRKTLRLAAFNVFTHNRDDHSNNFSFLMGAKGVWRLAPAYDLTFSRPAHGEHSLTVSGEGKQPGWKELRALADHFSVPGAETVLTQSWEAARQLPQIMEEEGVAPTTIHELRRHLERF